MGCAGSKRVEADVAKAAGRTNTYRPPPTSVSLFDVSTINELPWLVNGAKQLEAVDVEADDDDYDELLKKPSIVPLPLLEKLDSFEVSPTSWSEVSKALEDLKPSLLEEARKPPQQKPKQNPSRDSQRPTIVDEALVKKPPPELNGFRSIKDNPFILRDHASKKGGGGVAGAVTWRRRDPLEDYPEKKPPGGDTAVVLYSTSLRGVRRTFEDCEQARRFVESYATEAGVGVDERDVSLHGEFLKEVRQLLAGSGEDHQAVAVPRLFVAGRYIGGMEKIVELAETGKLRDMFRWVARMGGNNSGSGATLPRKDCEGCGGARFVLCLECDGSRKVVTEPGKEATVEVCGSCNENGLIFCPLCH